MRTIKKDKNRDKKNRKYCQRNLRITVGNKIPNDSFLRIRRNIKIHPHDQVMLLPDVNDFIYIYLLLGVSDSTYKYFIV